MQVELLTSELCILHLDNPRERVSVCHTRSDKNTSIRTTKRNFLQGIRWGRFPVPGENFGDICRKDFEQTAPNSLSPLRSLTIQLLQHQFPNGLRRHWQMLGLTCFKGHSIRAASASAARARGVSISDILTTAGWSRSSTFERFYHKQIASDFSQAILKS